MKKVIFISALAIAAAVSCTKSDIVDTKFNEQISFETYTGRDAMTKAAVATDAPEFGIYGYYTGTKTWAETDSDTQIANPPANLWGNTKVTNGKPATDKYWTNDSDFYSFLAYAPYETEGGNITAPEEVTGNPVITFNVPNDLTAQDDLIYSKENVNKTRKNVVSDGTVLMPFYHALSRITVKAAETHSDYTYTITGLELAGDFVKKQNFDIKAGKWTGEPSEIAGTADKYAFVLPEGGVAVNSDALVECIKSGEYLMVIPVDFTNKVEVEGETKEDYANAATLTIKYKTTYIHGNIVSNVITKTVQVAQNFEQGMAYSINLTFGPNEDDLIKFSVDVDGWDTPEVEVKPQPENPEEGTPQA